MMKLIKLLPPLIILLVLAACGPASTITPAPTEAPAATEAPTSSFVNTPFPAVTKMLTATPLPTGTPAALSLDEQMAQIDAILKQTISGSIAYNRPEVMTLDQTTTIELLLNPSVSPEVLSTQVTEPGQVTSASIQITPRMKALLLADDESAFVIRPIHDNPEQLISDSETTRWAWLVTAKKSGTQRLTFVIYRLVQFDGQDSWREVETYKADVDITVTMLQRIQSLDWAWIIGIIISAIAIPAFWRWYDSKQKSQKGKVHKKSRTG